jgi:hypothetical protein
MQSNQGRNKMLKHSKLISETPEHYKVKLPSGHEMNLQKKGLHEKAHQIIKGMQKFEDGGEVQASSMPSYTPENQFGATEPVQAPMAGNEIQPQMEGPATPPVQPEQPSANPKLSAANQAFEQEKTALQNIGNIQEAEGAKQAAEIGKVEEKIAKIPTQQEVFNKYQQADEQYKQALDAQKINPDRYWSDKSTGSKIAAGIGMLLGGFGGATGQANMAVNMIDKAIERDIDAQKNDQSKTMNLWKMNRDKMGNEVAANLATENQMYTGLRYKLEQAASGAKGQIAKQQALQGIALIDQKKADNNFKLSLMNSGDGDPAMKVQFLVPPERQKEVFTEIERAQNTKKMATDILSSFNQAVKENTFLKTGAGLLRTPGSVYALHQAMQPTFQDLEGTVRQAAMDNTFKNITPAPGDSDHTVETKRKALEGYLESKKSAPTAKGFGIDLQKHESTKAIEPSPEIKIVNGVKYMRGPKGEAIKVQ